MATGRAASRARRARSKARKSGGKVGGGSSSSSKTPYERAKALGYGGGSGSRISDNETVAQTYARGKGFLEGRTDTRGRAITPESMEKVPAFEPPTQVAPPAVDFTANNVGLVGGEGGFTTGVGGQLVPGGEGTVDDKYAGLIQNQNLFQQEVERLNQERMTGADIQGQLEKETGIKQLRQRQNELSAQLNTIAANRDAAQLGLEGQGRGITDTIIGGQQARIGREAAIQALPIQALLAEAQGNVELAQNHINTWGKIMMEDAAVDYNFKKDLLVSSKDFANSIQLQRLEDLDKANERKYQENQDLIKAKTAALSNALGQGAPSSVSTAIQEATTPEEVATALGIYNADLLAQQQQRASIAASQASTALNQQKLNDIKAQQQQLADALERGDIVLSEDQRDTAMKLTKDYTAQSSDFKKQVDAYNRIISSAEDPSPAGDLAVVFNYMKMLDPGSVVRESEFALAASTGSLQEALQNKFGKVATGEILGYTRDDFVDRAGKIYQGSLEQQINLEEDTRRQAVDIYGIPENAADLIIRDIRSTGAVSEVVFGLTLDSMSDEQLLDLANDGLIPTQ